MIYAQIKNSRVMNTIEVDEDTPLYMFSEGFDYFFRIDEMIPMPGMNWSYDGAVFTAPPIQMDEIEDI